jgi:uncharacterized protein YabN with tetrapyrrole methylase and pyrophosphatase domain
MGRIAIVGTGWVEGQLTLEAAEALSAGAKVILHTERCGCAEWLRGEGLPFESLDALYESTDDFDAHVRAAVQRVLEADPSVQDTETVVKLALKG